MMEPAKQMVGTPPDGTSNGSGQVDGEASGGGSILGMIFALLIIGLIGIIVLASRNGEDSSDE